MALTAIPTEESPLLNNDTTDSNDTPNNLENGDVVNAGNVLVVDEPSTAYLLKSMSGVFLGALVATLDSTMIATLSAPISESLGSLSRLSWLASAFFIANAAIQPISGKLTDIYGRKNGLVLSNVVFALGNLICALAQSELTLICGRLVAGLGGGGLMAISTFILSDLVPLRRRAMWQGLGNMILGTSAGIGGVLGGWINDTLGWRPAFALQIPVTVIAVAVIFFTIKIPIADIGRETESKFRRIDFLGATTLFTTLMLLLFALSSGGNIFPWSHPAVLVTLPLSLASLLIFILVELKYAAEPIIPLHLLWDRSVLGACIMDGFMSMSRYALLFYLPIFLQVQGYSATEVGLRLIPGSLAIVFTAVACGITIRMTGRYYKIAVSSQIVYLASMGMIATTFNLSTPSWPPYLYFFFANMGYGAMLPTAALALLSSVQQKHQAVASSAQLAFRSTGTVLGISLASLTLQNILRQELWKRLGGIENAAEKIREIVSDISAISHLTAPLQHEALEAYMTGLRGVFFVLWGMGAIAAVGGFIIRDRELPSNMSRRSD